MDTMSFRDILIVAIPEISLSILFGLLLINREVFMSKNRSVVGVFRFIVSVIIVLVVNYYTRQIFNHIILISYCTVLAYALAFIIAWGKNIRQSLIVGLLITYLIMAVEIVSFPLMNGLMQRLDVASLFSIRFVLSLPIRIIEIIIILTTWLLKINIDTKLINQNWNTLDNKEKVVTILSLTLFTTVIMFATNNSEIFVKLSNNGVDTTFINKNLQFSFYGIVLFMVLSILLFYLIIKCYKYKEIALKTPEQILEDIASISPTKKIHEYICILENKLTKEGGENE